MIDYLPQWFYNYGDKITNNSAMCGTGSTQRKDKDRHIKLQLKNLNSSDHLQETPVLSSRPSRMGLGDIRGYYSK
jgi:hypothetical protein